MAVHQPKRESAAELVRWLTALRSRARALLVTQRIAIVLAVFIAAAVAGAFLDYLARFPSQVRVAAWLIAVVSLGFGIWKLVVPALRLRPSLTSIALRVERSRPELKGLLAAAVDFESSTATTDPTRTTGELTSALEQIVLRQAVGTWRAAPTDAGLVKAGPTARGIGWLALVLALAIAPAIISLSLWATGAQRILTPWTSAAWPKRTGVADVTNEQVHALGSALPLRAALTKWAGPLAAADVTVRYRLEGVEGAARTERRELLTLQDTTARAGPDNAEWPMFERLIEPAGSAVVYRFETEDDATPWMRITLVEPPRVQSARATITPPAYSGLFPSEVDLGAGLDERALAPPMLAGSRIDLALQLNKNAQLPEGESIASILGDSATVESESVKDSTIAATLIVRDAARLPIRLVDAYGIESVEEPVFVFGAQTDAVPAAAVTEPPADIRVIPTAVVDVTGEGRDDVGLSWVSVGYHHMGPAGRDTGRPSQPGGAIEPVGSEVDLGREDVGQESRTTLSIRRTIDLSTLALKPGDEVHVTAIAKDLYEIDATLGAEARRADPIRSAPRIIRIISSDALLEEIREALTEVRQSAIRIESQQSQAKSASDSAGATHDNARAQAEIADRLERQVEAIQRVAQRVERNRLEDQALTELLEEAAEAAKNAAAAAAQAGDGLQKSATQAPQGQTAPADEPTKQAQAEALQETRRLIEMLDRGEDTWVVESRLRQMLDAQKSIESRTASVARDTAGKSVEQLSPEQKQAVEQVAQDQEQLAQDFERLLEEMARREQSLKEADPAAAAGMQAASQRARSEQTAQAMQQAAQQAQKNQMSNAGEQQERAKASLEQMLQDLQQGEQKRDERLRRMLRDIAQSIDGLIKDQEAALAALQSATEGARVATGLDEGMIALNRNTLGVVDMALAGGPELETVAMILDTAGDAQVAAIAALRAAPVDLDTAAAQENRSLLSLREARKAAEKEQEHQAKKEIEEKKAKLRAAYRQILEKQISVLEQTQEFVGKPELDRRERVRLRRLVDPQKEIGASLQTMVTETPELIEAKVFEHAHKRLDESSARAADSLEQADADRAVARQLVTVGILQGLVRALDESKPDEKKFEDDAGGGGGGGGAGGAGPSPLVSALQELALLRSIQTVVANETALIETEDTAESRRAMLKDIAAQQRELADVASELLSKLNMANPADVLPKPSPSPEDEAPAPEPAPEKKDDGGKG